MIKNLYDLLRLSNQLPPECQLNSGEVEWSDDIPTISTNNMDVYKGRFLRSEDVKIKVIRFVNMRDEKNVEVRHVGTESLSVTHMHPEGQARG